MKDLDKRIAEAARASEAESFGPYFAERTVKKALTDAKRPAARRTPGWMRIWQPAVALVSVLLVLVVTDWSRMRTVSTPPGQTRTVSLPDGSRVTLAPSSSISYRSFTLRSDREINLSGEAYLEVSRQIKPFIVRTFNTLVTVTGTRFNVRAWEDALQPETIVSLEEGGVRVEALPEEATAEREQLTPPSRQALTLTPGESARVNASGVAREERLGPAEATAWTAGGLALVDIPLGDALSILERRFNVRLKAAPEVARRPTTYVDPQVASLENVLDAICFALDLRYRPVLNGFIIEEAQ